MHTALPDAITDAQGHFKATHGRILPLLAVLVGYYSLSLYFCVDIAQTLPLHCCGTYRMANIGSVSRLKVLTPA